MKKYILSLFFVFLILLPTAFATEDTMDLDVELTEEEIEMFDEILAPVVKFYKFIKYTSTLAAIIALLYAGISFMGSGSDPKKREKSKNIVMYAVVGLIIIWGAPTIIELLI